MRKLLSPLTSVFLFFIGNGLVFTILVITMSAKKASVFEIGALTSGYFTGLALGSFTLGKLIARVGHIRAYSGFAATIIVIYLLHGFYVHPYIWIGLRLIAGIAIGGLLLVIESWLIGTTQNGNRGRILAVYMAIIYMAFASGQILLDYMNLKLALMFSVAAIMVALSIIPLAISSVQQPHLSKPSILSWQVLFSMAKVGLTGSFVSGLILGNIFGLLPLYFLQKLKLAQDSVGIYMAVTILGGVLLQYPIGKLSDRLNRPLLLTISCAMLIVLSTVIIFCFKFYSVTMCALFLFGGIVFSIYPLSVSHACDKLDSDTIIPGSQSLLLLYSLGATIGPLIAPLFIRYFTVSGLFIYFITISILYAVFIIYFQLSNKEIASPEQPYIALPAGTTPMVTRIDPRGDSSQDSTK